MQLLILGAGGIGGYFGGRLVRAGVDVRFLVRPPRAEALARQGLSIESPLESFCIPVQTLTSVDSTFDAILLACKAYDLDEAMDAIAPAVGPSTLILPLLNGVSHIDRLDARFGPGRVLGGLCHIGVTVGAAGQIQHLNKLQRLVLGARSPEQNSAAAALHAVMEQGGFGPVLSENIMLEMWEKFTFLATYAGMTTLMRAPIGAIASTSEGEAITREMLQECIAVAAAGGYEPRPESMRQMLATLTDRESKGTASMLRDMLHNGRTEHEHILGDMLMRARMAGLPAPLLRVSLAHMQAYAATCRQQTEA